MLFIFLPLLIPSTLWSTSSSVFHRTNVRPSNLTPLYTVAVHSMYWGDANSSAASLCPLIFSSKRTLGTHRRLLSALLTRREQKCFLTVYQLHGSPFRRLDAPAPGTPSPPSCNYHFLWSPDTGVKMPNTYKDFTNKNSTSPYRVVPYRVSTISIHKTIKLVILSLLNIWTSRHAISPSLRDTNTPSTEFLLLEASLSSLLEPCLAHFAQTTCVSLPSESFLVHPFPY